MSAMTINGISERNILTAALTLIDSLQEGDTRLRKGECQNCHERRGVVYSKRMLRQKGYCPDCLLSVLVDKMENNDTQHSGCC